MLKYISLYMLAQHGARADTLDYMSKEIEHYFEDAINAVFHADKLLLSINDCSKHYVHFTMDACDVKLSGNASQICSSTCCNSLVQVNGCDLETRSFYANSVNELLEQRADQCSTTCDIGNICLYNDQVPDNPCDTCGNVFDSNCSSIINDHCEYYQDVDGYCTYKDRNDSTTVCMNNVTSYGYVTNTCYDFVNALLVNGKLDVPCFVFITRDSLTYSVMQCLWHDIDLTINDDPLRWIGGGLSVISLLLLFFYGYMFR